MSAAPNHLVEIYRQLSEHFAHHHAISIVPVKGDPPDRYEITYAIKGLNKHEGGDVVETNGHVVELTIPFGFPHFPPSCKPKSEIFHPDFDPAAICLGDFWHQDCELPDLVIYLGQLINGEFFSRTNAFNEEACSWYEAHADAFPLAEVAWRDGETVADGSRSQPVDEPTIDTLDEDDLSPKFDFLAEETKEQEDFSPDGHPPVAATAAAFDHDLLHLLEKQKRFFALRNNIKGTASENLPENLHALFLKTDEITRKAENLFGESQNSEKREDIRGALAALEKITDFVQDFPDLDMHKARLRRILTDQQNSANQILAPDFTLDELADEGKSLPDTPGRRKKAPQPLTQKVTPPAFKWNKKLIVSVLGGSAAILLAGSGYYCWTAKARLVSAEAAFTGCTAFIEKAQFEDAQRSCEEALTLTETIDFIFQSKVQQLRTEIDHTLKSERMTLGLKGMILLNGKYIAKKDAELTANLQRLRQEAEQSYSQNNWQPAADLYTQILAMAEAPRLLPADDLADIKTKHDISHFRSIYDSALQLLKKEEWQGALTAFSNAEKLLTALPEGERQQYAVDLKKFLDKSAFEQSRHNGDLAFANEEWPQAISAYQLALSTSGSEAITQEAIEMIHRNMKRAELYSLIDHGIKAFGAGAWDEAIGDYRRAEELLGNQQAQLNVTDAERSIKKLSKIVLQALIVRDKQLAADRLAKNELAAAARIYLQLVNRIDSSHLAGEKEFSEIRRELTANVQSLNEKIFIAEKSKYLEDQYRTLFTANYPTSVAESLVNPVISYVRDAGDKAVFKMQCTETGRGRPLTLVMYYAFDKKSGQWELHFE